MRPLSNLGGTMVCCLQQRRRWWRQSSVRSWVIDGTARVLGPSAERLLKLIQTTMVVLSKPRLRRKWLQVVAGRWVHILAFRRPGMAFFDSLWKFASGSAHGTAVGMSTRGELFGVFMAAVLLRTDLKAQISSVTTASDASSTGNAVGISTSLTEQGEEFASMDRRGCLVEK